MHQGLSITYAHRSHTGLVRNDNQDSHGKFPLRTIDLATPNGLLFLVADGLGGHLGGKKASKIAIKKIQEIYYSKPAKNISKSLQHSFQRANQQIFREANTNPELLGMGTTCTALVLSNNHAHLAHVGDSRAYYINRKRIVQITQDHSKTALLLRQGEITKKEVSTHPERYILSRYLGARAKVKIDTIKDIPLKPGDIFVLCTDGLSRIPELELQKTVLSNTPQMACTRLIKLANEKDGSDNITLQIIQISS